MGVDMKVKAIYDSEIGNITRSEKNWKDVLKVAGQLYRYEFDNIVMVTAQRPPEKSTLMADYDTWKKVGRYVKRGAKGCAIFPSRALNPRMRYIFDISDTGGKNVKLTWDIEGENLKDYLDFLVSEGQIEQYDNSDRESLKNILKQFTGTDVWLIILFLTVSKNKIAATPENIGVVAILTVVLNYSILFPSFTFFLDGFHLAFGDKFEICIKTTDLM